MVTALELLDAGKRVVMFDASTRDRFGGLALWSFGLLILVLAAASAAMDPDEVWARAEQDR